LAYHYPDVPLHGDFTTIQGDEYGAIDLLVGGTPCQSFSIAGLRGGLDDDRGNLALEFLRLAQRTRPRWLVWENVPGVLSSNGGRDFGSILGGMVECGYGFAYRVLDAQYFGVAQRRRRVFVVGCLGDAASAAAVLFEREGLSGTVAPRRGEGQDIAGSIARCSFSGGAGGRQEGAAANHFIAARMVAFGEFKIDGTASSLKQRDYKDATDLIICDGVRRLTPVECERLQGFQDNFTRIPWRNKQEDDCPDGPRYKALGNSMAVPVMNWIGKRINEVEKINGKK
jgi:DNA (cytosine-5)-methyltransferase 1